MYRSPFEPNRFPDAGDPPTVDVSDDAQATLDRLRDDPPDSLSLAQADVADQAAALARAIFDHEAARSQLDLPDDRMDLPVALHQNDPQLLHLLDTARTIHASNPERWPVVFGSALEAVAAETQAVMDLSPREQIARDITNQTILPYSLIHDDLPNRLEHRYQGILNPGTLRAAPGSIWVPPPPGAYTGTLPVVPSNMQFPPRYEIQPINRDGEPIVPGTTADAFYRAVLREPGEGDRPDRLRQLADFPSQEAAETFVNQLQSHGPLLEAIKNEEPVTVAGQSYRLAGYQARDNMPIYAPELPDGVMDGSWTSVPASELTRYLQTGQLSLGLAGNALLPSAQLNEFDRQALRHYAEQNVGNSAFYQVVQPGESILKNNVLDYVRSMGKDAPEYTILEARDRVTGRSEYDVTMTGIPRNQGTLSRIWGAPFSAHGILPIGTFSRLEDAQREQAWLVSPEAQQLRQALSQQEPVTVLGTEYRPLFHDDGSLQFYQAQDRQIPNVGLHELTRYAYTGNLTPEMGIHLVEATQQKGVEAGPREQWMLQRFAMEAGHTGDLFRDNQALNQSYARYMDNGDPGYAIGFTDLPQFVRDYIMEHRFDMEAVAPQPPVGQPPMAEATPATVPSATVPSTAIPAGPNGPQPTAQETPMPENMQLHQQFFPDAQGNPVPVSMILRDGKPFVGFQREDQARGYLGWMQENRERLAALENGQAVDFGALQYVPAGIPGEYRAVRDGQPVDRQIIDKTDLQTALATSKLSPVLHQQWQSLGSSLPPPMQDVVQAHNLGAYDLRNMGSIATGNPPQQPTNTPWPAPNAAPAPATAHYEVPLPTSEPEQQAGRVQREAPAAQVAATAGAGAAAAAATDMEFSDEGVGQDPSLKTTEGQKVETVVHTEPVKEQRKEESTEQRQVDQTQERQTGQQKQNQDQNRGQNQNGQGQGRDGQGQGQQPAAGGGGFRLFGGATHNHYHTHNGPAEGGSAGPAAPAAASAPATPSAGQSAPQQPSGSNGGNPQPSQPSGPTRPKGSGISGLDMRGLQSNIQQQPVTSQEVQGLTQKIRTEGLTQENQNAVRGIAARKDFTLRQVRPEGHEENQKLTASLHDLSQTIHQDQTPGVDPAKKKSLGSSISDFAKAVAEAIQRILARLTGGRVGAGPSM
jgi:hypothetical protein